MISSFSSFGNNINKSSVVSSNSVVSSQPITYTSYSNGVSSTLNTIFNNSNSNTNFIDTTNSNTTWINLVFTAYGNVKLTSIPTGKNVYLLAVGGGGAGTQGDNGSGGGGAGGFIQTRIYPNVNETITVTIGSGASTNGASGGNTTVVGSSSGISITAYGGGGAGNSTGGGSGGGQNRDKTGSAGPAYSTAPAMNIGNSNYIAGNTLQGNNGGSSTYSGWGGSGGGGGAGAAGGNGSGNGFSGGEVDGAGGIGRQYTLPGIRHDYYWAGGGGGGGNYGKYGGLGGGGQGCIRQNTNTGTAPTTGSSLNLGGTGNTNGGGDGGTNTGGGGGGSPSQSGGTHGGYGGSGIVIIAIQQ